MSEMQRAANALMGLSAGLSGRGMEFQESMQRQEAMRRQQEIERQKTVFTDSQSALNFARQGRFDLAAQLGMNRLQMAQNFPGVDFSDTEMLTQMAQMAANGDNEAAENLIATLENNVQIGQGLGILEPERAASDDDPASVKETRWFLKQDEATQRAHLTLNPTMADRLALAQAQSDIKVSESGRKVGAEGIAKREQGFIDSGLEAVDGMSAIQDAISLLDDVKTGGFSAAALRAKQMFGIESADEGELANALGTAVLSNLKPIFGSAFTAQEGERLERLSAGFGKSPETNRRLLTKQMEIAERAAKRALSAARKAGDDFTAEEIESALDKVRGMQRGTEKAAQQSSGGTLKYNPQTGELE